MSLLISQTVGHQIEFVCAPAQGRFVPEVAGIDIRIQRGNICVHPPIWIGVCAAEHRNVCTCKFRHRVGLHDAQAQDAAFACLVTTGVGNEVVEMNPVPDRTAWRGTRQQVGHFVVNITGLQTTAQIQGGLRGPQGSVKLLGDTAVVEK